MRTFTSLLLLSSLVAATPGCQDDHDDTTDRTNRSVRRGIEPVSPSLDIRTPPKSAKRTKSGLDYQTLSANETGVQPKAADTAVIHYTAWRQRTGEMFFSSKGRGQPISIDLAHAAPGFAEVLPLLHKGETAVVWLPASPTMPEPTVYEIEIVDVIDVTHTARQSKQG